MICRPWWEGPVGRDSNGKWLWGFAAKVGRMEVDRAELHAVRAGLQIAWEYRIPRICVEMDSAVVFHWLSNPVMESHPLFHIIEDCIALSRNPWTCEFRLVRRSSNDSADMMAKKGQSTEGGCVIFDAPPDSFDVI